MEASTRVEMPVETPVLGEARQPSYKWQRRSLATPGYVLHHQGMPTSNSDVWTIGANHAGQGRVGRISMRHGGAVLGEPGALAIREDYGRWSARRTQSVLERIRRALRDMAWAGGILASYQDLSTGTRLTRSVHV